MLRLLALIIGFLIAASVPTRAQDDDGWHPPPAQLAIGYEGEGKVDATPAACERFVREMVEWSEEDTKRGIEDVCAARKRHVEAYAAIQKSYKALVKYIEPDTRLNPAESIKQFEAMIKACIDHKMNINTGGHNIYLDMIPNHVAAECLKLGKQVLDGETGWYEAGGSTAERPAP